MSTRVHERWAHLRFSVIGQLLAAPPDKGELRTEIEALAARTWQHPTTGKPVRFGFSTIERWYYRALRERADPVGVLRRKIRAGAGQQIAVSDAVRREVVAQYAAHKSWSVKLHYDNLDAAAKIRPELRPVPSYPTLRRFMRANGLDKRRRLTSRRTDGAERAEARIVEREVRRYEAEYVNGLWHWDCHHGSRKVITARGEWVTPILLGVLDDRSRLACHLQWYLAETAEIVAHGLSQAFQKRGLPRAALSDNGGAMTAAEITEGLARLGILHHTTLPYSPYQNAKQEAFWGPVEGRLIAMLEHVPDLTLAFLNEANVGDPKTLLAQVEKARKSFGLERLVMVGDRGMISNVQIDALEKLDGVDWITALKTGAIAKLADNGHLQLDLFDERNLISFTHEDYPGERLVACRNPALAARRAQKRGELIAATVVELEKVAAMVRGGRLAGRDKIGVRVGKVIGKYKVAKHFDLDIEDGAFGFRVNEARVAAEAALDGLYVIRTSVGEADMTAEEAVLNDKRLAEVERAFRTLKGVDLNVRPIRHRLEQRVKAHILLSMLAYYVQWHMIQAWAPLTFADEAGEDAARRADPVAPAKRSKAALAKVHTRTLPDGTPAMSFTRLLAHLATIVRNTLTPRGARPGEATFTLTTRPTPKQQQALDLLAAITV